MTQEYFDYNGLIKRLEDAEEVSPREAEKLAQQFFLAGYYCNKEIRRSKKQIILTEEVKSLIYRQSINNADGKGVTEKKINAEADGEFLKANSNNEDSINEFEYYKRLFKVLENGYTLFKLLSREN